MSAYFYFFRLAAVLTSLLAASTAQAQRASKDYIVTTTGDTLRGRIRLMGKSSQTLRLYRKSKATANFTAEQARSYGTGSVLLKTSQQVGAHGKRHFLVPLVLGYVNLYVGKNKDEQVLYFLQPQDSSYAIEVNPSLALLAYARLLPGCPTLEVGTTEFLQRYPYTEYGLTKLVTDYSTCRQQPTVIVKAPSGLHLNFGIKAGINYSSFNLSTDDYSRQVYASNHSAAIGYEAGLLLLLTTRSNFAVQLEGNYLYLSGDYGPAPPLNYNSGIYSGTYAVRLRYSQVQLPALLRYNISNGLLTTYLNIGPVFGANFRNNFTRLDANVTGTTFTETPYPANISAFALGAAGGVGLAIHIAGTNSLFAESRYDYMADNVSRGLHHSSLHLNLGILF